MDHRRRLAYAAILINVVIWGAALPIVKPALNILDPFTFLLLRYLTASLVLIPIAFITRPKHLSLKTILTIAIVEFIQVGLGHTLLYIGLDLTSALEASLIASTSPILVTIGGIIFLREKEEKREWIGLSISIIGTLIVILVPYLQDGHSTTFSLKGNSIVLAYNFCWMVYLLIAKRLYSRINKLFVASISSFVGLISYLAIVPLLSSWPTLAQISHPAVLFSVLYMGILGTPIAVALYLYGQDRIEASEATLFTYLQPLIYIPLSVFWLGDRIIPIQLLGLIAIAIGVIIAEFRPKRAPARSKR